MPFVVRADFQLEGPPIDPLGLTQRVNAALREVSARGAEPPWVYLDTAEFPDGYQLAGTYRIDEANNRALVNVYLIQGVEVIGSETLSGTTTEIDALAERIITLAGEML